MTPCVKGSKVRFRDFHNFRNLPMILSEYREGINVLDEKIDINVLSEYTYIVEGIFYDSTDRYRGDSRRLLIRALDSGEFKHRRFIVYEWAVDLV